MENFSDKFAKNMKIFLMNNRPCDNAENLNENLSVNALSGVDDNLSLKIEGAASGVALKEEEKLSEKKKDEYSLTIAHLYPKLLNIYGDGGNVLTLKTRIEKRNINCKVVAINPGDEIDPYEYDIFFIGGGQDRQQTEVSKELQNQKENLFKAAQRGAVFLAICGGYQLLGKYYEAVDGERLDGIGLLDAYTVAGNKRFIGNVTAKIGFLNPETLVGFENHAGLTFLEEGTSPLASVCVGNGNNGRDKTEGARKFNVFGTYLHGSVLPKNPHFADYLIELAMNAKYFNNDDKNEILGAKNPVNRKYVLTKIDDELEFKTHKELVNKSY